MDSGWKFSVPDAATLDDRARQEKLFWWRGRDGLFTYWEDEEDGEKTLGIGFTACEVNRAGRYADGHPPFGARSRLHLRDLARTREG